MIRISGTNEISTAVTLQITFELDQTKNMERVRIFVIDSELSAGWRPLSRCVAAGARSLTICSRLVKLL
jgi:hypothetical protein